MEKQFEKVSILKYKKTYTNDFTSFFYAYKKMGVFHNKHISQSFFSHIHTYRKPYEKWWYCKKIVSNIWGKIHIHSE